MRHLCPEFFSRRVKRRNPQYLFASQAGQGLALAVVFLALGLKPVKAATPIVDFKQDFSTGSSPAALGFESSESWSIDPMGRFLVTPDTTPATGVSEILSPAFYASRNEGAVTVLWSLKYPTDYGASWRENNKLWVTLSRPDGTKAYELLFKPNRPQDRYTSYDLQLRKFLDGSAFPLVELNTHTLTPHGKGAAFLRFEWTLEPARATGGTGRLRLRLDLGDGKELREVLSVTDDAHADFSRLTFKYKTGPTKGIYRAFIDSMQVATRGQAGRVPGTLRLLGEKFDFAAIENMRVESGIGTFHFPPLGMGAVKAERAMPIFEDRMISLIGPNAIRHQALEWTSVDTLAIALSLDFRSLLETGDYRPQYSLDTVAGEEHVTLTLEEASLPWFLAGTFPEARFGNGLMSMRIRTSDLAWKGFTFRPNDIQIAGPSLTSDARPVWSWSSGNAKGSGIYRFRFDHGAWSKPGPDKSFQPPQALSAAIHTLEVQERNLAGQWNMAGRLEIEIDPALPAAESIREEQHERTYEIDILASGKAGRIVVPTRIKVKIRGLPESLSGTDIADLKAISFDPKSTYAKSILADLPALPQKTPQGAYLQGLAARALYKRLADAQHGLDTFIAKAVAEGSGGLEINYQWMPESPKEAAFFLLTAGPLP